MAATFAAAAAARRTNAILRPGTARMLRSARIVLAVLFFGACELEGVAAPPSEDIVVVEAVLRAGTIEQHILLHRSLEGRTIRGEPGARVSVTSGSGREVVYGQVEMSECLLDDPAEWGIDDLEVEATCYRSPADAGRFVVPGEQYDLRIETTSGGILRGRTTVPRAFGFNVPDVALDPESFSVTCNLPTHPFTLTWTRSEDAWAYVTSLRLTGWGQDLRDAGVEVPDPLDLSGVSVSAADTSLLFPANLGLFQRFDLDQRVLLALQQGLPPATLAELVIIAADRNYVNWIRGGRFNPSGNVRGSSVAGDGVGVFGSVIPLTIRSPGVVGQMLAEPPAACPMP